MLLSNFSEKTPLEKLLILAIHLSYKRPAMSVCLWRTIFDLIGAYTFAKLHCNNERMPCSNRDVLSLIPWIVVTTNTTVSISW
jgi:hypothetical protein